MSARVEDLGVLGAIIERTRARVAESQRATPLPVLMASVRPRNEPRRRLDRALDGPGRARVIAEIKRRSPSKGALRSELDPAAIAASYEASGAAAISVLTEPTSFGGSLDDLERARRASKIPVLRKDFLIDRYQIWEARRAGADAALLIAAALDDDELEAMIREAEIAEIEALVEVHDREELSRALAAGARIIGVNSRDLRTLSVRLETALEIGPLIPAGVIAVAESGIRDGDDIRRLRDAGFDAFLIGEQLMRSPDPGAALVDLIRSAGRAPGKRRARPRPAIKICGITSLNDARLAADLGADQVGFVFVPGSPRFVDRAVARRISAALPDNVERVGVFLNASRSEILDITEDVGLDRIQLHGDEPPEALEGLPRKVIKALRVGPSFRPADALRYAERADFLLLDAAVMGGAPFDWSIAADMRGHWPSLMLAGGLTPENVGAAIEAALPDAVDVASGVEASPGRKDPFKLKSFFDAVERASSALPARSGGP